MGQIEARNADRRSAEFLEQSGISRNEGSASAPASPGEGYLKWWRGYVRQSVGPVVAAQLECWRSPQAVRSNVGVSDGEFGVRIHVSSGSDAGAGLGSARELTPFMCA